MLPKMRIGIIASMSMGRLWQDAFTIVKIMVTVKITVSLSSKAALPIAPVRFVGFIQNDSFKFDLGELSRWMPM